MQKKRLLKFIDKYSLSGTINAVVWKFDGKDLSTLCTSQDNLLVAKVSMSDYKNDKIELGIDTTDQLDKLLRIMGDDLDLSILTKTGGVPVSLQIRDERKTTVNYSLSDIAVIPPRPKSINVPDFDVEIPITPEFVSMFVNATRALSGEDFFTVASDGKETNIVIGYGKNANSHRITLDVNTSIASKLTPISFTAKHLREALLANKEVTGGMIKISQKGMCYLSFDQTDDDGTYTSEYYLIFVDLSK